MLLMLQTIKTVASVDIDNRDDNIERHTSIDNSADIDNGDGDSVMP